MADNETPVDNKVDLQLQDIIQIEAPDNDILNEKQFVITFISTDKIKICNVETLDNTTLLIDEEGNLHDSVGSSCCPARSKTSLAMTSLIDVKLF